MLHLSSCMKHSVFKRLLLLKSWNPNMYQKVVKLLESTFKVFTNLKHYKLTVCFWPPPTHWYGKKLIIICKYLINYRKLERVIFNAVHIYILINIKNLWRKYLWIIVIRQEGDGYCLHLGANSKLNFPLFSIKRTVHWFSMFGLSECSKTRNPKLFNDLFYLNPLYSVLKTEKKKRKKAFWNQRILKRRLCILVWTGNVLKTEALRKRWVYDNHDISLPLFYSNANPKKDGDCCVKILRRSVENIWCVFRVNPPFSNSSGPVWKDTNMFASRTHPNTCLSIHSLFCNYGMNITGHYNGTNKAGN